MSFFHEIIQPCVFEFIGTFILILLGDGVVAGCCLKKSKGEGSGWVVITLAWGFAVMCGVFIAGPQSGAHLNPAVSLGLAIFGSFKWSYVLPYIIAQMLGAFCGALLVYAIYKDHFDATEDPATKLGVFCTGPAIRNYGRNVLGEFVGTWLLVFCIIAFATNANTPSVDVRNLALGVDMLPVGLGSSGAFPVTMLIMAIGMSLGGVTGYAINPARDLAPRLAHAILPIKGKGTSDWKYSWVPVAAPLAGAAFAALCGLLLF